MIWKEGMLQISQVIFYLLLCQLPEPWALCAFYAFVAEEVVGRRTDDA